MNRLTTNLVPEGHEPLSTHAGDPNEFDGVLERERCALASRRIDVFPGNYRGEHHQRDSHE